VVQLVLIIAQQDNTVIQVLENAYFVIQLVQPVMDLQIITVKVVMLEDSYIIINVLLMLL